MSGGGMNTSATRAEALTFQSSVAGAVIPWLRGMHRVPGNLVWYGDLVPHAHTQQQGGKGGGGSTSTTYTYTCSLVMIAAHGPIQDIPTVWKGKSKTTRAMLGLSLLTGAVGQAVWSGLSGKGVQAIGYSGLAGVAVSAYDLGSNASVENHSFEVRHASAYGVSASTPDVDPVQATRELLIDPLRGAAMPAAYLGDWSAWSDYCVASGLLMSPLLLTQVAAHEALQTVADLTNSAIYWSEGKLKVKPYGDAVVTGNGRTYTPDTTPVYQLDDSCYVVNGASAPIKGALKTSDDCFNFVTVEYKDRSNGYNVATVTARDGTDIAANGVRPMDTITAHWICDAVVARLVAELKKQRSLGVVGTYTFSLPWHYALIECMDLLTLTDTVLLMQDVPVRVIKIKEESDDELTLVCEDYPPGMASAPRYAAQVPVGYATNGFVAPGSVATAQFFEPPSSLSSGNTGLEVWAAVQSPGPNWGGCTLWVSLDGTTYRSLGRVEGGARIGSLNAAISGSTLDLVGVTGQLNSATASAAASLETLCYLGGATPEYFAYQVAALTGAGAYTLTGLVRGVYGSAATAHQAGVPFIRVDSAIAKSGPLDLSYIGKTIYFKATSFNLYGGAEQSLADVSAFQYTVTGKFFQDPVANVDAKVNALSIGADGTLHGGAGGQVTLPGLGVDTYRVQSWGASASSGVGQLAKNGTAIPLLGHPGVFGATSYNFCRINRSTGLIDFGPQAYDVFTNGTNSGYTYSYPRGTAALAADLNATDSSHIAVIWTYDEPKNNRLDPTLAAAMYRCGASPSVYGSSNFKFRAAYILVGIGGCGVGNGAEAYQGAIDNDPNAWCDLSFTVQGGNITGVSSNFTPKSLTDYGYVGDLNAAATVTLINQSGMALAGNSATKTPANGDGWNASITSKDSYVGGAFVSFVPQQNNAAMMIGLNTDPLTNNDYASIDCAMYCVNDGTLMAYESGTGVSLNSHYNVGDVLAVTYDGSNVRYLLNGTVLRTVPWLVSAPLFLDSSFHGTGGKVTNIQFGPMSSNAWASVGGAGKPQDNATVGAAWGSNISGQPSDAALLNSQQQWSQVSGSGRPADNATVGATWGSNISGTPTNLAQLAGSEGLVNNDAASSFGFNPSFSPWTGAYPQGWGSWQGNSPIKNTSSGINPWAVQYTVAAADVSAGGCGAVTSWSNASAPLPAGTYLSGSVSILMLNGAPQLCGYLVRLFTNSALTTYVDNVVTVPNPGVGGWQKAAFTAGAGGQPIYGITIYQMAGWQGFAGGMAPAGYSMVFGPFTLAVNLPADTGQIVDGAVIDVFSYTVAGPIDVTTAEAEVQRINIPAYPFNTKLIASATLTYSLTPGGTPIIRRCWGQSYFRGTAGGTSAASYNTAANETTYAFDTALTLTSKMDAFANTSCWVGLMAAGQGGLASAKVANAQFTIIVRKR